MLEFKQTKEDKKGNFSAVLGLQEKAIGKYQNRAVETAPVIEELMALAKQMREASTAVFGRVLPRQIVVRPQNE